MATYLGDFVEDSTHYFHFHTTDATGLPVTLAASPIISVYKDDNLVQTTAGVTLTEDFDFTGLHSVKLILTDAFYVTGTDYSVVITVGTVNSVSVVGYVVATFSIENRFAEVDVTKWLGTAASTPTIAGVPEVDVILWNGSSNPSITSSLVIGTAQAGAAATITLASGSDATDNFYNGTRILLTGGTGSGQSKLISSYVGLTKIATVDNNWVLKSSGTAQSAGSLSITFASGESSTDDFFNNTSIEITGGTGSGQTRIISDYVGSTRVATITVAWTTTPDSTSTYEIRIAPDSTTTYEIQSANAEITDISSDLSAILLDTTEMQGKLPTNDIMGSSDKEDHDTDIDSILEDTGEIQGKLPDNNVMGSSDKEDHDEDIDTILTNVAVLLNRVGEFSGTSPNDVLGFLKAIMDKNASTPSDVGGTFSASEDSNEAIADSIGGITPAAGSSSQVTGVSTSTAGTSVPGTQTGTS